MAEASGPEHATETPDFGLTSVHTASIQGLEARQEADMSLSKEVAGIL